MAAKTPTAEIVKFDFKEIAPLELAKIETLEDAVQFMVDRGITPKSIEDFGDGFKVVTKDAKNLLVGKGFFALGWRQFTSDKFAGAQGVALYVITTDGTNEKFCIIDMSTGIAKQIREEIAPLTDGGVLVPNGLTRSDYTTTININGEDKEIQGTTFYLDTSVAA